MRPKARGWQREVKRIDLIFITSDTGLAGAFNSNLLKASQTLLRTRRAWGAKSR